MKLFGFVTLKKQYTFLISQYKNTQKMVLDAALLRIQIYNVWIKGKVEKSRERE